MAASTPSSFAMRAPAFCCKSIKGTKEREASSIACRTGGGITDPVRVV